MVFSSHIFLFGFLPAALLLYGLMPRRGRNLLLTFLSYLFYGWTNPLFVLILLFSTAVDYVAGLLMTAPASLTRNDEIMPLPKRQARSRLQKLTLWISLGSNLGLLGFFKYFNFGVDSFNALAAVLGFEGLRLDGVVRVVLPLGISFYTFQSMSYTIDVYRGNAKAIRNFVDFACYVSMFPQLVAGPIIRFSEVADQLVSRVETREKMARGIACFCLGLAKKVILANPCGKIANLMFDGGLPGCLDAWYGAAAYAFQIYFDFSGYSDMAIGLGLMLGFVFPKNFDSPYRSRSITEFWQRWHISLSSWLKDYLYIPLGGNRGGAFRTYRNLMLVMLLGGLWHGAAWTFVVWGCLHGVWLAIERWRGKRSFYRQLPGLLQVAVTFVLLLVSWVFFRAVDLPSALLYLGRMFNLGMPDDGMLLVRGVVLQPYYMITFIACCVVVWMAPQTWNWTRRLTLFKLVVTVVLLGISIVLLSIQAHNPFIYFMF